MFRLTEANVAELIDMKGAMRAVAHGLRAEAAGEASALQKAVLSYEGGGALHMLGAAAPGLGIAGVKTWTQRGATAHPELLLFDSSSMTPVALIEANMLSHLRTGALAGIATQHLAAPDAAVMGVIGSGKQATAMIQAVLLIRDLHEIRIWSPTPANREALAKRLSAELGLNAVAAPTAAQALDGAEIVGLAARVQSPVITIDMIAPQAHVNSIGTTVPGRAELPQEIFARCTKIHADSPATVRAISDDFRQRFQTEGDWEKVRPLAELEGEAAASQTGMRFGITLYKGMGSGVADLAMGAALIELARAAGDRYRLG